VSDAGLAVLALLVITVLSVYKPWGRTRYGLRKQQQERRELPGGTALSTPPVLSDPRKEPAVDGIPVGLRIFLAVVGVIVAGFAMLHLGRGWPQALTVTCLNRWHPKRATDGPQLAQMKIIW
jgi:hypothetical protein